MKSYFFSLFLFGGYANAFAGGAGVWVKGEHSAQVNVACFTKYACRPPHDIMYEGRLVVTPPETVWGVCNANGSADQCTCVTNSPETPCEWEVISD